jgi:hypothetical protein
MSVEKQLLKDGIEELNNRGYISAETQTDMNTYIDNLSEYNVYEVNYSGFNETGSTNITFDLVSRTALVEDTDGSVLISKVINLTNIRIKALKIKSDKEDVLWFISTDGTNYYSVDSFNIDELVTSTFYVKVTTDVVSSIKGLMIIYTNS